MPLSPDTLNQYLQLAIEKFSEHVTVNTKLGAIFVAGLPIVIFAGIFYAWAHGKGAWKRKEEVHHIYMRSMSIGLLHGGHLALQRLVDYHEARAEMDKAEKNLEKLLAEDRPHFRKLQSVVAKLEMTRKEANAVAKLKRAFDRAQKNGKRHEAYEFGMLLVEMYIYKGDLKEALSYECLKDEKISDARRPLYKAIILILSGKRQEGKKCWDEFNIIRENLQWPGNVGSTLQYEVPNDFNEFENLVKLLMS